MKSSPNSLVADVICPDSSRGTSTTNKASMPFSLHFAAILPTPSLKIGLKYENNTNGLSIPSFLKSPAISIADKIVVPAARALWLDAWMTAPSAIGSENGTPSSTISAPALHTVFTSFFVKSSEGSPQLTNATRAARFCAESLLKSSEIIKILLFCVFLQIFKYRVHIFVPASRQAYGNNIAL